MAKHRLINTKFRSDWYVMELDPSEKLLFLYYLTNEKTDLSGMYEIPLRIVSFETGYDREMIMKIESRFSTNNKMYRHWDWVYIINFVKNQLKNPSIEKWIQRSLENIPKNIKDHFTTIIQTDWHRLAQSGTLNLTKPNLTKPKGKRIKKDPSPPKEWLKSYWDYVKMLPEEYQKLIDWYWDKNTKSYIKKIDLYIWSTWQTSKYKDYYKTVLAWFYRDWIKMKDEVKKHIPEEMKEMTDQEKQDALSKMDKLKSWLRQKSALSS